MNQNEKQKNFKIRSIKWQKKVCIERNQNEKKTFKIRSIK